MKWHIFLVCSIVLFTFLIVSFRSVNAQNPSCLRFGDLDCSGTVNLADLSVLLSNFGRIAAQADVDGSGRVNLADLTILLGHFGQTSNASVCYGLLQNIYSPTDSTIESLGRTALKINTQNNTLDYWIGTGGFPQTNPVRIQWGTVSYTLGPPLLQNSALIYQGSLPYTENLENKILFGDFQDNAIIIAMQTSPLVEAKAFFGNNFTPTACDRPLVSTTASVPSLTPTPPIVWIATHESATGDEWSINENTAPAQDSNYCSRPLGGVSDEVAHRGTYSLKMLIDTTVDHAGCRTFRYPEAATGRSYYYSAWFYFPENYIIDGADPNGINVSGWTNLMQFKAKRPGQSGGSDLFWSVGASNRPDGKMYLFTKWDKSSGNLGPRALDDLDGIPKDKQYHQDNINIYPRQWFHLEVFLNQSTITYDGRITVWQDGVEIFDMGNVLTKQPVIGALNSWSVNSYGGVNPLSPSASLYPRPYTVYVDDAVVSTQRIGPDFVLP